MSDIDSFLVGDVGQTEAVRNGLIVLLPPRDDRDQSNLPAIENAASLLANQSIQLPPQIVNGVLHQGLKGVIASASKARKTWILLDMALSVSTGTPFWGWPTTQGRVLVVNFEIPTPFLKQRVQTLCNHKEIGDCANLDIWTLRGFSRPFDKLIPTMVERVQEREYSLIIIDPIYKGLAGRDENKAGDIAELCNAFEMLAVETGAAVVYAHHFSKGNAAAKEPMDRLGGSGVFARDADTIMTLTPHDETDCYTVDLTLRNLPELESFVVEWEFPVMVNREDLDPDDLKGKGGRPQEIDDMPVLDLLKNGPLTHGQWKQRAQTGLKMSKSAFDRCLKSLREAQKTEQIDSKWQIKAAGSVPTQSVRPDPANPVPVSKP